jgi:hypothetical protein
LPSRRAATDVLVVMNPRPRPKTSRRYRAVIVLNESIKVPPILDDRLVYNAPMTKLMEPITTDVKLRRLVVNMIYVGVSVSCSAGRGRDREGARRPARPQAQGAGAQSRRGAPAGARENSQSARAFAPRA